MRYRHYRLQYTDPLWRLIHHRWAMADTETGMDMDMGMCQWEGDIIGGATRRDHEHGGSRVRVCGRLWRSKQEFDGVSITAIMTLNLDLALYSHLH